MLQLQFNIKRINQLKDIILQLRHEASKEQIQLEVDSFFKEVGIVETLLMEQELLNGDYGITIEDLKLLSNIHPNLYGKEVNGEDISNTIQLGHPVQILIEENKALQSLLEEIEEQLNTLEHQSEDNRQSNPIELLQQKVFQLGEFHKHYHRKEKLLFPILERYGYYAPTRLMWKEDDRIRALYQGIKRQVDQLPHVNMEHIRKTYDSFSTRFRAMVFQEESIIFPMLIILFKEEDWTAVARESSAFGYALIEPELKWASKSYEVVSKESVSEKGRSEDMPFGGGYLTTEEANLILNHLPLEITFVDKNSVFKYFNNMTEASEMMLVRTPTSIGRNVANCHPPNSLKKVMTLVRDLKTKKRTSESMWFKKKGQYVHLTYKAIFNEADEFLGILEYVQDIQPFLDLPSEVKTGLSELEE